MKRVTLALALLGCASFAFAQMPAPKPERPVSDFVTFYPGKFSTREQGPASKYLADNQAIRDRGPVDVKALVEGRLPKDTPGIGPVIKVTAEWVRYNNAKWDPDNRLLNDAAYARSLGYKDTPAQITFGAHDDSFMIGWPGVIRDRLLVGELNHSVTSYRPVYAGDTLFLVTDSRDVIDLTPVTGSTYRSVAIETKGSVYNQRGEKVNDVVFRVIENERLFKSGPVAGAGFFDIWEGPAWMSRPAHVYTDKDWTFIRSVWAKEAPRGNAPLYWQDVKIGDKPNWSIDGPVEASVSPVPPWGQGAGGSRTMKREIMDPAIFKTMIRGEKDGIWRMPERAAYVPSTPFIEPTPGGPPPPSNIDTRDIHKQGVERAILVNYFGREIALRHVSNWAGDRSVVETIKWTIMGPKALAAVGKKSPGHPNSEYFLDRVPSMRGKAVMAHGLTGDIALVKSEVVGKQVRNGKHYVDLVWWIEAIDGAIWEQGLATVRLPSRGN